MSEKTNSLSNSDLSDTQQNITPHAPYLGDFGKFCDGRDDNLSDKRLQQSVVKVPQVDAPRIWAGFEASK